MFNVLKSVQMFGVLRGARRDASRLYIEKLTPQYFAQKKRLE
jgi:hypothetical protein